MSSPRCTPEVADRKVVTVPDTEIFIMDPYKRDQGIGIFEIMPEPQSANKGIHRKVKAYIQLVVLELLLVKDVGRDGELLLLIIASSLSQVDH